MSDVRIEAGFILHRTKHNHHPFHLPPKVGRQFQLRGMMFCRELSFSSTIDEDGLERIMRVLRRFKMDVEPSLLNYDQYESAFYPTAAMFSVPKPTSHFTTKQWEEVRPRFGRYLAIYVGYEESQASSSLQTGFEVAALIRTLFGSHSMLKLQDIGTWRCNDETLGWSRILNFSINVPGVVERSEETVSHLEKACSTGDWCFSANEEALAFLKIFEDLSMTPSIDQPSAEKFSHLFLLLWTALEKQLGNGNARARFFRDFCRSTYLSDTVAEMWENVRNGVIHQEQGRPVMFDDLMRLRSLIDLSFICDRQCAMRAASELEQHFRSHTSNG